MSFVMPQGANLYEGNDDTVETDALSDALLDIEDHM